MLIYIKLLCLLSFSLAFEELRVKVEEGILRGTNLKNLIGHPVHSFLGIPYAKQPVEQLRFADPVPVENWDGIKDATTMPDYCLQHNIPFEIMGKNPLVGSEDCLYLNVYTPAETTRTNLPVLVFIHGGGFMFGSMKEYNHKNIMDYEVVLVTLQYRLGIFGFISTDEAPLTGNYGLKDQQLALKWVKKNIAQFRGDPNRITIMGESAGAASVHYHILSSESKGLFNRAVMLSGNALCPWARGFHHRKYATLLGTHFNCPLEKGSAIYRECMLKIDANDIVKYFSDSFQLVGFPNYMLPRVDGLFIKNYPELLHKYQVYNNVDVMMSITRDEGAYITMALDGMKLEDYRSIFPFLLKLQNEGDEDLQNQIASTILEKYQNNTRFSNENDMMVQLFGDRFFNFPHHVTAQYFAKNDKIKTFVFELSYKTTSPNADMLSSVPDKYISHMEDARIIFNGGGMFPKEFVNSDDIKAKNTLLTALTMFARVGDPTSRTTFGTKWQSVNSTYFKQHNIKHILDEEDKNTYNVDELLNFWYSLPLEQTMLLRSDNRDKINKIDYFPKENVSCHGDCKNINIKAKDWIEKDKLKDYEWIKENEWLIKSVTKEEL